MDKQIVINKVSLSGGIFPKVGYDELLPNNDKRSHPPVSCTSPAHRDLVNAFSIFTAHLALICEEITNEQFIDSLPEDYDATEAYPEKMEMGELIPAIKAARGSKMKVTTTNSSGKEVDLTSLLSPDENTEPSPMDRFVITQVEFKRKGGKEIIVLTGQKQLSTKEWMGLGPTPDIKDSGEYKFTGDLFQCGELLKYELAEYIINNKYAPPVDPELPFGDGIETGEPEQF